MSSSSCRGCGAAPLETILDLGHLPLANGLPREADLAQPDCRYPLVLAFCPSCALVQITHTVAPEDLFRDYLYFSSYSDTMLAHAAALVERTVRDHHLDARHLVVEVASNDGYLLTNYRRLGVPVLGIEPAQNVARVAQANGIPTLPEFFGQRLGERLAREGRHADVIHAHNVLAHVPDPNDMIAGMKALLSPDGLVVIEVPYAREMIERIEFDTIYHEHFCYFSVSALSVLIKRHGLAIVDIERVPIHGGSLRIWVRHHGTAVRPSVTAALAEEDSLGITDSAYYRQFAGRVSALRERLVGELTRLKTSGRRLAAYGAAAKGAVLLNFAGIGVDLLDFVADRSPHKQGRYVPGVRVPIVPTSALLERSPDYVLLLTWNFEDEIRRQQAEYLRRGGRFVVPLPEVRLD